MNGETVVLAEMIDGDLQKFTENLYETIASFGGINMYISSSDAGKTLEELEGLYDHSRIPWHISCFINTLAASQL